MMRQFINIVENASPSTLYHQSPSNMRERIAQLGLQHPYNIPSDLGVEMSNDETQGIYFTYNREDVDKRFDMWEVDVRGLTLHPDETTDWPDGHTWWVTYDEVGPERLQLVYQGTGLKKIVEAISEEAEATFLGGSCGSLALAIHNVTGWPARASQNHVWVVNPNGNAVDIRGVHEGPDAHLPGDEGMEAHPYKLSDRDRDFAYDEAREIVANNPEYFGIL